jgi:hypothetical protein
MSLNIDLKKPLILVGIIFGAIVGLQLLAAFMPSLFQSTRSITENITTADVGNAQANSLLNVFGFLAPVIIVLGLVGLIVVVAQFRK